MVLVLCNLGCLFISSFHFFDLRHSIMFLSIFNYKTFRNIEFFVVILHRFKDNCPQYMQF